MKNCGTTWFYNIIFDNHYGIPHVCVGTLLKINVVTILLQPKGMYPQSDGITAMALV